MSESYVNLGRTALRDRGAFDPTVQYENLDIVSYQGYVYCAYKKEIPVGTLPTDSNYFHAWFGTASAENTYQTNNETENSIADDDYFPFLDTSAELPKKTPFSNIKMLIAGYFNPVGTVIQSTSLDTEAKVKAIYGGNSWQKIEGRVLVGQGGSFPTVGATGGKASEQIQINGSVGEHTLTSSEIPSHNHTFTGTAVNTGNQSANHTHSIPALSMNSAGGHSFRVGCVTHSSGQATVAAVSGGAASASGTQRYYEAGSKSSANIEDTYTASAHTHATNASTTGANSANHTHSVTASGTISSTGGGNAHGHDLSINDINVSTLQPYKVVYIWERVS